MNHKSIIKVLNQQGRKLTLEAYGGMEGKAQGKISLKFSLQYLFLPKNNHWLGRNTLVFGFHIFDHFSTLVFVGYRIKKQIFTQGHLVTLHKERQPLLKWVLT